MILDQAIAFDRCMSAIGPSRHFAASQQFGRFRSEADISGGGVQYRIYEYAP
jgi:hypothetical protein